MRRALPGRCWRPSAPSRRLRGPASSPGDRRTSAASDSSRKRLATTDPIFPNGGRYSSSTRISVPRSPVARSNQTVPEFSTVEPGSDRHEMRRFGSSAVISASHSTELPPGARVFQCVRRSPVSFTDSRWLINRGRFSKRAPEAVHLLRPAANDDRLRDPDAALLRWCRSPAFCCSICRHNSSRSR